MYSTLCPSALNRTRSFSSYTVSYSRSEIRPFLAVCLDTRPNDRCGGGWGRNSDRLFETELPRGHSLYCFLERSGSLLSSTSLVSDLREAGRFTPDVARLADCFLFWLTLSAVLVRTALGNFLVQRVGGRSGRARIRDSYLMTASQSPSFASCRVV